MAMSRTWFLRNRSLLGFALCCALFSGCQSSMFGSKQTETVDEEYTYFEEEPKSGNILTGWLRPILTDDTESLRRRRYSSAGRPQVEQAQQAYDGGNIAEAEKLLKPVIKKRQYLYTPAREDALYLSGNIKFERKEYADAEDEYGLLLKDYPNSRYTDEVTRNLFTIAKVWLDNPNFASSSDIRPINYERPNTTPPPEVDLSGKPISYRVPILPNLSDDSRPLFDTPGRALNALRTIWMRDPTGELADDALMLAATYFLRRGEYREADRYFAMLRTEYPKSPHLESAFVLGSQVKLMSYQGAEYDAHTLENAEKLKQSTIRLFPDSKDIGIVHTQLEKVQEMKAGREWEKVEFYQSKGKPKAVAVYCGLILKNHPQSSFAPRARQVLASLPPEDRPGMDALLGSALPTAPSGTPTPSQDQAEPRRFPRFPFRRVPKPEEEGPKLKPLEIEEPLPLEALDRLERSSDPEVGTAELSN